MNVDGLLSCSASVTAVSLWSVGEFQYTSGVTLGIYAMYIDGDSRMKKLEILIILFHVSYCDEQPLVNQSLRSSLFFARLDSLLDDGKARVAVLV